MCNTFYKLIIYKNIVFILNLFDQIPITYIGLSGLRAKTPKEFVKKQKEIRDLPQ